MHGVGWILLRRLHCNSCEETEIVEFYGYCGQSIQMLIRTYF